jgi:hypothetical protein
MKTFDELNLTQRLKAYADAKIKLHEAIRDGDIVLSKVLEAEEFLDLAEEIAENATYDDDGQPYTPDMDIPYHFFGGCI